MNAVDVLAEERNELKAEVRRLKLALKETLDAMDLGDYPARHIAFSALSEGGGDGTK